MKKLAPIFVVILALLMQVRVAYACEATGLWPSEHCHSHGSLIVDTHPDAPSDRGDRCDVSLDLAVRAGRTCTDVGDSLSQPTGGDVVALLPAALALGGLLVDGAASSSQPPQPQAGGAGTRTWLSTARLRL